MKLIASAFGPNGWGTYSIEKEEGQPPVFSETSQKSSDLFIPGFVDVHIHGAFGIDFMSASSEQMVQLADQLALNGYSGFLPTTITATYEQTQAAINQLPEHPLIWGVHLEGPFISPDYPGAQPPEAIQDIPLADSPWQDLLHDTRLKLITLAPEKAEAKNLIEDLIRRNVIVSAGHTNATYSEIAESVEWGLSHATHTYNAMRPLHHREAGTVGAALNIDSISAELIYDRLHVSKPAAEILLKSKPHEKVIAVSDCTMAKGIAPGTEFTMWDHQVIAGEGEVRLAKNNALAGSAITLLDAFRNLSEDFGPETATRLCCLNPRIELQMDLVPSRFVVLDKNSCIQHLVS